MFTMLKKLTRTVSSICPTAFEPLVEREGRPTVPNCFYGTYTAGQVAWALVNRKEIAGQLLDYLEKDAWQRFRRNEPEEQPEVLVSGGLDHYKGEKTVYNWSINIRGLGGNGNVSARSKTSARAAAKVIEKKLVEAFAARRVAKAA